MISQTLLTFQGQVFRFVGGGGVTVMTASCGGFVCLGFCLCSPPPPSPPHIVADGRKGLLSWNTLNHTAAQLLCSSPGPKCFLKPFPGGTGGKEQDLLCGSCMFFMAAVKPMQFLVEVAGSCREATAVASHLSGSYRDL